MHPILVRLEPLAYRGAQLLIVGALAYGAWTLARPHLSSLLGNPLSAPVVTFDVVKLANAQRKVAAAFIRSDTAAPDAAAGLMSMQKTTRATIERVAGPGTVVLVKQAVVSQHLPDITDAVLRELGLPTDAPTQDATAYTLDEAPTNLSLYPPRSVKAPPANVNDGSKLVP